MLSSEIDPIIFSLGPLHVRWYGLMYVLGFLASYLPRPPDRSAYHGFRQLADHFENLNLVLILAVVIGGRLGYVLFYNFSYYLAHPLEIPATWSGGMSFHGACLGVLVGGWMYSSKKTDTVLEGCRSLRRHPAHWPGASAGSAISSMVSCMAGSPMYLGRWSFPMAVLCPATLRSSTKLCWRACCSLSCSGRCAQRPWQKRKFWPHGSIFALFLAGYGLPQDRRCNLPEPDQQIGFLFGVLTMGQLLSGAMVAGGLLIWKSRLSAPR